MKTLAQKRIQSDTQGAQRTRVVILGAGFGGIATALRLAKRMGDACEITLIDKRSAHVYTPLLYEVASGYLHEAPKGCVGELRSGICIAYEEYTTILGIRGLRFLRAEVKSVDKETREVHLGNGTSVAYDYLVVALGSETADYGIPGVKEFAYPLKTMENALAIRKRLRMFIDAHLDGEMDTLRVVVCGAGPSGVEFASEVAIFFERLRKAELIRHRHAQVILIDSGATVLGMCNMTLRRWAEERLKALGVEIRVQTKVKEVREGSLVLMGNAGDTEEVLDANMVVWTAGIATNEAVRAMPFAHDERGRIAVEPTLLVQGETRVFALGDATGNSAPLAQSAILEGRKLADTLARALRGERLAPMVLPKVWPSVITLGGKYAIADVYGFRLRGVFAYVLRKIADLEYFVRILPFRFALKMFWQGSKVYVKND